MKFTKKQLEKLGLEITNRSVGCSSILNCPIYKFKNQDEIYISRYDFGRDISLEDDGLWYVIGYFYANDKGVKKKAYFSLRFSDEMLEDCNYAVDLIMSTMESKKQIRVSGF